MCHDGLMGVGFSFWRREMCWNHIEVVVARHRECTKLYTSPCYVNFTSPKKKYYMSVFKS